MDLINLVPTQFNLLVCLSETMQKSDRNSDIKISWQKSEHDNEIRVPLQNLVSKNEMRTIVLKLLDHLLKEGKNIEETERAQRVDQIVYYLVGGDYLRTILTPYEYQNSTPPKKLINGKKMNIRRNIAKKMVEHYHKILHLTKNEIKLANEHLPYVFYKQDNKIIRIRNTLEICLCKQHHHDKNCPKSEIYAYSFAIDDKLNCDQQTSTIEGIQKIEQWTNNDINLMTRYHDLHRSSKLFSVSVPIFFTDPLSTLVTYLHSAILKKIMGF